MAVSKNNPLSVDPRHAEHLPARAAERLKGVLTSFVAEHQKRDSRPLRICCGFSGGRDSVVLLHALSQVAMTGDFPLTLAAVHVHHGISSNADAWAAFCADFCRQCNVPLNIVRVDVPRDSGEGLEAAARRMRHAVFANCDADWLALAHHRDDQAETVLLNLLRGAGIAGAAGMLAERPQVRGPSLVRPLLDVPRQVIEDYAVEQALRWIDDESNEDLHYRRNFLRRDVLPRLEEKFPGAQKSLGRAASHFAEGAALLDDLAAMDRAALSTPSGRIGLKTFNALSPGRARNVLRFAWGAAGFRAPDTRWIDEALKQLSTADVLSETCLKTLEGELHVYRGELYIVGHRPALAAEPVRWSGEAELPWAGGRVRFVPVTGSGSNGEVGIRRRLLDSGEVLLWLRQGGERIQRHAKRPHRSLRNVLQEMGIPPWERNVLPFMWCNGKLAWVGGVGVDAAFFCAPGEEGVLPVWDPEIKK